MAVAVLQPHPRHAAARWRERSWGYVFLAPMVIAILAFTIYPLAAVIQVSFTNSNGVRGDFVGLANYNFIFHDPQFWRSVVNTLYMGGLSIFFGVSISLAVATLINFLPAYQAIFKTVYFLPNVTSAIAAAISFIYLLYPTPQGWVNVALGWVHLGPYGWFIDPAMAPLGMVLLWVWHSVGYMALIWIAGFQTIPKDIYEAAAVDGASRFRSWLHITVPLLRPILLFLLVIEVIAAFKRFADVYQIGGSDGQPGGSLATMMVYIYRYGFATFSFGTASAASVVAFVLALVATLSLFALLRER